MVRQSNSKLLALFMTFILILNTLTPMTVVFAEETVTNFNKDGIKDAELVEENEENEENQEEEVKYTGEIKSIAEENKENLIVFDLSNEYKTADSFIGFEHNFYLDSAENVSILNKDDKKIDLKNGYIDFIQEANKPYKIKLEKEDEEVVEYTVLVKTADYVLEPELKEIEEIDEKTFNYGTTEKDLQEKLPKELTLILSDSTTKKVAVDWDLTDFVVNQSGEFTFKGSYDLPEKVTGEILPIELKVIILAETVELENLIKTAKEKSANDYTETSFNKLLQAIKEAEEVIDSNNEAHISEAFTNLKTAFNALVIMNDNYEFNKETGTITKYIGSKKDVVIPEEIDGVKVKEIGDLAFGERNLAGKDINSVTLPDTVEKVGERAFYRAHLTKIILSNNLTEIGIEAFKHNNLEEIVIPESIRTIKKGAFEVNKLTKVTLPNGLTTINKNVFKDNNLTEIELPNELTEIGTGAFASNKINELVIPTKLKEIKGFANNELTKIEIPRTVEKIGKSAFASNDLKSIEITNSVTHIGDHAFADMDINELIMGDAVQEIGKKAFYNNELKAVELPEATRLIKDQAFNKNVLSVNAVKIDNHRSKVSIGNEVFNRANPIFLKDVKKSIQFEKFDIVSTSNKNHLLSGNQQNDVILFNQTPNTDIQELIRDRKASFHMQIEAETKFFINGKEQAENEVYYELNVDEENIFTLEKHGIKKEYTVNLDNVFINKKLLEEQLTAANKAIDSSLLTEESEKHITNILKEAEIVYESKTSEQEEVDQITLTLKNALEDMKYILEVNLKGEITKYNGNKEKVIIPSSWNGTKITQINKEVFANNNLKEIVIPETIKIIEESAFANNNIEKVNFEVNQLANILQEYDYFNLNQANKLTIKANAFKTNNLTEIYLPYQVNNIADEAFSANDFEMFSVKIDNYKSKVTLGKNVFDDISPSFLRTHIDEVDKTYLTELIDQHQTIEADQYTKESYANYQAAYDEALLILKEKSTEEEVVLAFENLLQTKKELKSNKELTKTDLTELVALIKSLNTVEFDIKASDIDALWSFIQTVEDSLNKNLTETEIKQLYERLNEYYEDFSTKEGLFGYKILNNHEIIITEYRGISSSIIIPDEIDGRIVTQIGENAFNDQGLSTVSIPETIYKLGNQAFANNKIENIQLPKSLKQLGTEAFRNNLLNKIEIPERLEIIPNQAFNENPKLTNVYLAEGVKEINKLAFSQNKIDEINFPDSLVKIGELAFANNEITKVDLSSNVVEIGTSAFNGNKIGAGEATINNVKKNVKEQKHAFANNGADGEEEIELIYNGTEEITIKINPVDNIEVAFDTDLSVVQEKLPQEIEIEINRMIKAKNIELATAEVKWESETYDSTEPGIYEFVGEYDLPEDVKADKPELIVEITVLDDKTDKNELEAAINYAVKVNDNPEATVEEVEQAVKNLNEKLEVFKTDNNLSELEQTIEDAKNIDKSKYTADSIEKLEQAIKEAEIVLKDEYISQAEIAQAVKDLEAAIEGLVDQVEGDKTDTSALVSTLETAKATDTTGKTDASIKALAKAIEKSEAVLADKTSSQAEIDQAVKDLKAAIKGLIDQPDKDPTDTSALVSTLKKAKATDTTGKTDVSIKALAKAIEKSEAVLADKSSSQAEIDQAVKDLKVAIKGLVDQVEGDKADTSALVSALETAKATDTTGKTDASIKALNNAIKNSEAVLADETSTQAEIDQAVKGLEAAIEGLVDQSETDTTDTSALILVLEKAENTDTTGKTDASIKALNKAIEKSEAVLADKTSTQAEIGQAVKDLEAAIEGLVDQVEGDKADTSALVSALETAKATDTTGKTDASIKALNNAIKKSEAVLADKTSTQAEIDQAVKDLKAAIEGLVDQVEGDTTDTSALVSALKTAKATDTTGKTDASIKALDKAIKNSEIVLADKTSTQAEIDQAVKDLEAAIEGLVDQSENEPIDTSDLVSALETAKSTDTTGKTDASIKALDNAIKNSEAVLADETSTQAEIDQAVKDLEAAIEGLVDQVEGDKADTSALILVLEKAKNTDTAGKTDASIKALDNAIKKSESVLTDEASTQAEIDQAVKGLEAAIKGLIDQPAKDSTDTSALVSALEKAKATDTKGKTAASIKALDKAIKNIEAVLANEASTQAEIDQAVKDLEAAIEGLVDQSDEEIDSNGLLLDKGLNGDGKPGSSEKLISKETDKTPKKESEKDKKLPSSATNIFNLFALGLILIISGLLLIRKRKPN